jgi:hypothetical protein
VRGSPAGTATSVQYFAGTTDITANVRSATGLRAILTPSAEELIRVRIVALPDAVVGPLNPAAVTGTWIGDGAPHRPRQGGPRGHRLSNQCLHDPTRAALALAGAAPASGVHPVAQARTKPAP